MSADIEFEIVKPPLEEINKQYEGCDISECFAQLLHIQFQILYPLTLFTKENRFSLWF
jgi:hypothetical protein